MPQTESATLKPLPSKADVQASAQTASPPKQSTPGALPSICVTTESITEGLRVAKTISSSIARDNAFAKLVDSSLCNNDIELARTIAAQVNSSIARDNLLGQIVEKAVATGKSAEALKIAEEISSSIARDNAKHKLLDALNGKRS